ncbi:hypothetical protein AB0H43_38595 [Hamadaea sp. NPDC050747]|uniref:hypothetical protein n=1 Tax=Hamadaea sp. NPDC050747 TaxID=3155789 RepID=UPI0033F626BD
MTDLDLADSTVRAAVLRVPDGCRMLVSTDAGRGGVAAMTLPFADATIVDAPELGDVSHQGPFDVAVLDLSRLRSAAVEIFAVAIRPLLGPDGVLVVVINGDDWLEPGVDGLLAGWEWVGVADLAGAPAAVVRPGALGVDAGSPFLAAWVGAGIATARAAEARRLSDEALTLQVALTAQSEEYLLKRVAALADEVERVRRDHQGKALVRTLLRRSVGGRALLRLARVLRRL